MKRKRKRFFTALLLAISCFTVFVGCKATDQVETEAITCIEDLAGKKVASQTGAVFGQILDSKVAGVHHLYLDDVTSQLEAVESGKAAAALMDEPIVRLALNEWTGLTILEEKLAEDSYGIAFKKGDPLGPKVNQVIRQFREDGTLDEIADKWFFGDESIKVLPELTYKSDFDGSGGVLRLGYDNTLVPMSYVGDDGKAKGYDIELAMRIAYELNMEIKLVPVHLTSRIETLSTGKIDMLVGCISITEERKKSVDFSEPYYIGGMVVVIKNPTLNGGESITQLSRLEGKKVGVMTGSTGEIVVHKDYPQAKISSFDSFSDAVAALGGGKLDYVAGSYTSMLNYVKNNPNLAVLPEILNNDANAIALKKGNTELRDKLDAVLNQFREDGTLDEITKRWIKTDNEPYQEVEIPKHADGDVLRVAISADREPVCFMMNAKYVGFDCELIERIAYELGMRVEYQNMKFGGLISALQADKVDLVISNLTYTEERAQSVEFTQTYFDNPQVLLTRKTAAVSDIPWYKSLADSFEKTFLVENRWMLIVQGLGVTMLISVFSAFFGTILGFAVCMMRRAGTKWLSVPARLFIGVIQGTPVVVMLMILYYIIFGKLNINPVLVSIIGFTINFSAYVSEMMRTGIDAVDKGQLEAAGAIGFNRMQVFIKITMPQAARHVLPVFKGEFISMIKMTSVVGYIAIQDLTKMSDIIRSRTYEAFFPLIITALIYLALSYMVAFLLSRVEIKVDPKHRKRIVKGVKSK